VSDDEAFEPEPDETFEPEPDEAPEVAALDSPRAEKVARAYLLHCVQGESITFTAEALKVSRATAWRMAKEGEAQAAFLQQAPAAVALTLADATRWVRGGLAAERDTLGGRWLDYAPVLLKAIEQEGRIRGAYAPNRVAVQGQLGGPTPDPETIAALTALMDEERDPTP